MVVYEAFHVSHDLGVSPMGRVRHMYDVGIAVGYGGRLRMQYEWYRKQSLRAALSSLKLQVFIRWEEKSLGVLIGRNFKTLPHHSVTKFDIKDRQVKISYHLSSNTNVYSRGSPSMNYKILAERAHFTFSVKIS